MRYTKSTSDLLLSRGIATSFSVAAMLLSAGGVAQAQDASSADSLQVEEIVVTARKREESLLETPVAISAITGDDLAAKGIANFNQLADAVPGINISNISAGAGRSDRSFQSITLRGIVPSTTLSTLTSTFIDGAPVASPTAVANVSDPARVEILKGSQAAYFGRNTFAGAVNVVNKMPGEELGGSASVMAGSRGNIDAQGSLDGQIFGEKLGFRLNVHHFSKDGSYKNAANPSETLGDQETTALSLMLTSKITENLTAKLYAMRSEDDDGAPVQGMASAFEVRAVNGVVSVPAQGGSTAGTLLIPNLSTCNVSGLQRGLAANETRVSRPWFCGAIPQISYSNSPAQNTLQDSLLSASLADPRHRVISPSDGADGYGLKRKYDHVHLNLDYQVGETGFTVSSLTALNAEGWSEVADLDNYDTARITNPANPTGLTTRRTAWDFPFMVERETYDFSQELRVSYDREGPFTGLFGVSYLKTTVWNDLVNIQGEVLNAGLASGNRDILTTGVGLNQVTNKAVFFGGSYKFTDALKLNVEGRYQQDYVVGRAASIGATVGAAAASAFGVRAGTYAPLAKIVDEKYNKFLPRVILQYDVSPDLMTYVSYSKGINVGTNTFNTSFLSLPQAGIDAAVALGLTVVQKPEQITNYELGVKGKFLDDRLQLQSAVYYSKWTDQLNNAGTLFINPLNGQITQVSGLLNTGGAKLKGIEIEAVAKPVRNLELNLAAALTDSSIDSYAFPQVSQITGLFGSQLKGKQLPGSSKLSYNAGVQYGTPLSFLTDGRWFARADLSWKDKQYIDASNSAWIKARTVVNLRAGISRGALGLEAFVLNAGNDKNYTAAALQNVLTPTFSLTGAYSYVNLSLPELRTYGARVSYKF